MLPCGGIDLTICQLFDTSMSKYINSIENYLLPQSNDFKSVMIWGYPRSVQDFSNHSPAALFMRMPDKHFEITNIPDTAGVYDPFQYAIT